MRDHPHRHGLSRVGLLRVDDYREHDNDDRAKKQGSSESSTTHSMNPSLRIPPPPGRNQHRTIGGGGVNAGSRGGGAPATHTRWIVSIGVSGRKEGTRVYRFSALDDLEVKVIPGRAPAGALEAERLSDSYQGGVRPRKRLEMPIEIRPAPRIEDAVRAETPGPPLRVRARDRRALIAM